MLVRERANGLFHVDLLAQNEVRSFGPGEIFGLAGTVVERHLSVIRSNSLFNDRFEM
jgi:hypothetical protein